MTYTYKYPRPSLTVDILLFRHKGEKTEILLIQRKHEPFKEKWAFPGGFIEMDETLEEAAKRELTEETNLRVQSLKQFKAYDDPDRDPRGRTISIVFYTFLKNPNHPAIAGDDAKDAQWYSILDLPPLAFDHDKIITEAIEKIIYK